jgi:ligand-binding sensor domain-containing protein/signal transduction histidine kinase
MLTHHTPKSHRLWRDSRGYGVPTPKRGYGVPKRAVLLLLGVTALFGSTLAFPLPPGNVQSRYLGGEAHSSGTASSGARQAQTADESAPAGTTPSVIASQDLQTQEDLPPPSIRFERISIEQGLSFSVVQSILQDRQGFLWIGTGRGLNKYDGYQFTVYRNDPADSRSLSNDSVDALYEDSAGELWVGTDVGLDRLDRTTSTFVHYQDGLEAASVNAIYEDRNGVLWVGSGAGLYRLNRDTQQFTFSPHQQVVTGIAEDVQGQLWVSGSGGVYLLDPETGQGSLPRLGAQWISAIRVDAQGDLWVGAADGLRRLDRSTDSFVRYQHDPDDPHSLIDNRVQALLEDSAGRLWVGTRGGLDLFDRQQNCFVHYQYDPYDPHSLSDNLVLRLYEDRSGVLWVGTLRGLSKYSWAAARFTLYTRLPAVPGDTGGTLETSGLQSLSDDRVIAVHEDRTGNVWVGMYEGGLNRLDRTAGKVTAYRHDPADSTSLSSDIVRAVYEDRSGTLWVGTDIRLERFDPDRGTFLKNWGLGQLPTERVFAIAEDHTGELWVGTQANLYSFDRDLGVFRPYQQLGLSSPAVNTIYGDETGLLWVGTLGGGLYQWDGTRFTSYRPQGDTLRSLSSDFVLSVYTDLAVDSGAVWVGTNAGGLLRFDRAAPGAEFTQYTEKDGLPGDRIACILADANGFLWLGTNRGVSKFDPKSRTFRNYDARDGLQSGEFIGCFQSSRGEMFFGGLGGLNAFYPEQVEDNPRPPPIAITAFRLFNEARPMNVPTPPRTRGGVPADGRIQLSYQQNDLSFEFAALDYHAPGKNQYAYRLEGVNRDWVSAGTRRYADYTNLRPGKYVFRVKGSNNDGVWNEEGVALYITIQPPFWQTWWFRGLVAVLLVAGAVGGYRRRIRSIELRRRELETQVQERTAELRRESEQRMRVEEALRKSEMEKAVAEERGRLARELHDAVTQTLFSASLIAEVLPELWQRNRDEALRRLEELRQLNRGALAEMRTLLLELRPAALEKAELRDLLRQLADALRSRAGLAVVVEADEVCALPTDVKVAFYRIAQEALNNIVKHARANQVNVRLRCETNAVELEIADDGKGFDPTEVSTEHHGLRIMRERAEAIGARFQVKSEPGHGTQVLVTWTAVESRPTEGEMAKGEEQ